MSVAREKFLWMQRLLADRGLMEEDRRLTDTKTILIYCAQRYPLVDEDVFSVRQETIADSLGMHINTVANAFRRARQVGWLELAGCRQDLASRQRQGKLLGRWFRAGPFGGHYGS